MLPTVGEAAAEIRWRIPVATVQHSAAGPVTLTTPVVAGLRAMRVRVVGPAGAAVAAGVLAAASGGSERVRKPGTRAITSIGGAKCFIWSLIATVLHGPSFP